MNTLAYKLIEKLAPVLYEDDHLLAVNKPAGVDVGETANQSTVGLVAILAKVSGRGDALYPVNRLSRDESGILLLGKDAASAESLRADLRTERIAQEYVGIVRGEMRQPRIEIGAQHGASRGRQGKSKPKETPAKKTTSTESRTTVTRVRKGTAGILVRCQTRTKSTHALRAQLRSAGLRLFGDHVHDRSPRAKRREPGYLHLARITVRRSGTKLKCLITSKTPEPFNLALDGMPEYTRPLEAALLRRIPCMADRKTDSFRLLTGSVEGVKGLAVEKYSKLAIFQLAEETPQLTKSLPSIARWYLKTLDLRAVYVKRFVRDRTAGHDDAPDELHSPKPFVGTPVPEQIVVVENGLKFAVRPYDGFSVGLFLDHRENRKRTREMADGRDVLNLFAYTCGFSVAAASGGASSTVSVDLSPKCLEWGRTNFELNGLDPSAHEFHISDAMGFLQRAKRKGREFGLVILDPPSFAHGRKRKQDFSITRDLPGLIEASIAVLRRDGLLLLATNYRRFSWLNLREQLSQAAGRRKFKIIDTPRLPLDFASDPDYAKTIIARFV